MARSSYRFSYIALRELRHKIFVVIATVFFIFILSNLVFSFLLRPVMIKSSSMYPSSVKNSMILVSPLGSINRGDTVLVAPKEKEDLNCFQNLINRVVSFFTFQQIVPISDKNMFSKSQTIRRVVGIPGDTIYMKDYVMYIKPAGSQHFLTEFELSQKNYDINIVNESLNWDYSLGVFGTMEEKVLDENEYFLLCDNRVQGVDSRIWGVIPEKDLIAKAILQYFPFNLFGLM